MARAQNAETHSDDYGSAARDAHKNDVLASQAYNIIQQNFEDIGIQFNWSLLPDATSSVPTPRASALF
jgi:hypothetical protein